MSLTDDQIELFMSLFQGRKDVYARRWEKDGRSGWSPAYAFNWNEFSLHKSKGGSMKDFENKKTIPLTEQIIRNHLSGFDTVGVYPILSDNTSHFLAADFDGENWFEDAKKYMDTCIDIGLSAHLERSRSGNGGHVWIFFAETYPCYKSRLIGLEIIRQVFNISPFEKEVSFDRLFPNQDSISSGGFGNLIALPLQGKVIGNGNTLFVNPDIQQEYIDQWEYLKNIKKHSIEELDSAYTLLNSQSDDIQTNISHAHTKSSTLSIFVDNRISLSRSQLTPKLIEFLKEKLNFLNTEYLTRKRLGKSVYQVQKYFKLIGESENDISLPRGFLGQLISFLESEKIKYQTEHTYPNIEKNTFKSLIHLTPAQNKVLDQVLLHNQGVIVAPPGSGKTMMGMELIARQKLPALILVHRQQLLEQWVERIETYLNIPKLRIGRFSGAKKKIGKEITVGLLQSLGKYKNIHELSDKFGTIIIDECHHIPAKTFREVIVHLNPPYLYGLTATPKRKHNDEKLIYVYIGDILASLNESDKTEKIENGQESKTISVVVKETNLEIPFKWKTDHFNLLAKIICFDTQRNKLIIHDIQSEIQKGNRVLVLSERKEHLEILELYLKGQCEIITISGDDSVSQRTSKIKQIQDGHYQVILSTGQFFGEGLHVQNINSLVLAFPFSFEGKLIQYTGRLLHGTDPKSVFDYRDIKIDFLDRQFKQRQRYYNKLKKSNA